MFRAVFNVDLHYTSPSSQLARPVLIDVQCFPTVYTGVLASFPGPLSLLFSVNVAGGKVFQHATLKAGNGS